MPKFKVGGKAWTYINSTSECLCCKDSFDSAYDVAEYTVEDKMRYPDDSESVEYKLSDRPEYYHKNVIHRARKELLLTEEDARKVLNIPEGQEPPELCGHCKSYVNPIVEELDRCKAKLDRLERREVYFGIRDRIGDGSTA